MSSTGVRTACPHKPSVAHKPERARASGQRGHGILVRVSCAPQLGDPHIHVAPVRPGSQYHAVDPQEGHHLDLTVGHLVRESNGPLPLRADRDDFALDQPLRVHSEHATHAEDIDQGPDVQRVQDRHKGAHDDAEDWDELPVPKG
jgi:hypothetical protein